MRADPCTHSVKSKKPAAQQKSSQSHHHGSASQSKATASATAAAVSQRRRLGPAPSLSPTTAFNSPAIALQSQRSPVLGGSSGNHVPHHSHSRSTVTNRGGE